MGVFRQFPYSNFHEMNMDEIIKIVKTMNEEWIATKSEWVSYKEFIDNYFNNLNVSNEVLSALRTLASTGELNRIIDPVIASETTEWLTEHITQPTTPLVDTSLSVSGAAADAKVTGDKFNDFDDEFNHLIDDTMNIVIEGSYFDFSAYNGQALFGVGKMFPSGNTTFDIDVSDVDIAGKSLSTYMWLDSDPNYLQAYITEVQLDTNGNQIYPTSGYHYIGRPMVILPNCKKIRLYATLNAYNTYSASIIRHVQLTTNGVSMENYSYKYRIKTDASELKNVEASISYEPKVISNNQLNPENVIGQTFGMVNDQIIKIPLGKNLAQIANGYANFAVYMNTGTISGYYQLVKEDGTSENPNYLFNSGNVPVAGLTNSHLITGIKIHAYSAGESTLISSFGLTFNHLPLDTFVVGDTSNVNPASWRGKKWVAYGDSITASGVWEQLVVKRVGVFVVNCGLGSSCVATTSLSEIPSFTDASRISQIPTDADIVTIMGGTNDYAYNIAIGSLPTDSEFDTTEFIGALCETVRLIQNRCPNAVLVIMSNIGGRGSTGVPGVIPPRNNIGLSSVDYANAAKTVADFMGVPFIDTHRCGINPMNRTRYITDSVHPNDLGNALIARKVIDYLVNNY